ncbi:nitrogenase component 1 [Blautia sp. HCP28S3_G10]|uniref:nitrogenase component 1 n=1 Tax=Blautia sp. HCP28S3_G10 TaxID=3438908 RepID=UPI003F88B536
MRQAYRIIPVYTADVSGVCSALYELGGMVVMHDPSGCNSTYNTHDEIRWYDQDSLIYITGLTEIDAILGNDEKFIRDIEEAAEQLKPKFIALAGSPIPYMNGTDFPALAQIIEEDTGIPTFAVPTNGMHDYVRGAGMALEAVAEKLVPDKEDSEIYPHTVNLLGVTPLDFGPQCCVDILKENIEKCGWKVFSTWAMGDNLENLARAGQAEVNLVVSSTGLRAARKLKERFGTPYVTGTPLWGLEERISESLDKKEGIPYLENRLEGEPEIMIIGEPVTMGSLAAAIEQKYHCPVRVLCPLEETEEILGENDRTVCGEEEIQKALQTAKIIIADPLYHPVCPPNAKFYKLPHIAFSGRIYRKELTNISKKYGKFI